MAEFNLSNIFQKIFGYVPDTREMKISDAAARTDKSILGQAMYGTDAQGREFFLPVTLDGYFIPFAVLSMSWKKTYVNTAMPERGGSVKELINIDDYVFNLKGLFIDDLNEWPEQGIIDIYNIFKKNKSIRLQSAQSAIVLSGEFEERVVIKDIRWPPMNGVQHAIAFEMNLESDMIFDLIIN